MSETGPRLDFDRMVQEAVESMQADDPGLPLLEQDSTPRVFDPRFAEAIRNSEDINTPAPAKSGTITSYQQQDGSWYVEVKNGACFRVEKSWQAGEPAQWSMTRCNRRSDRLELEPKPWTSLER